MQDPRVRFAAAFFLSLAAFLSLWGAAAVFVWWLAFTPRWKAIRHPRAAGAAFLLFAVVAAILSLTGGNGISYLARMTAILLVGAWVYADSRPGDFLAAGTWLLGTRAGFELGMVAGMALSTADGLAADFDRIRISYSQKGLPWGFRAVIPAGRVLVMDALRRAEETAEVLAVRGYRGGGTACTQFRLSPPEIFSLACAAAVLAGVFVFP